MISFLILVIGLVVAPICVDVEKMSEADMTRMEILQFPHLFIKTWYRKERLIARRLVLIGLGCLFLGFLLLFFVKRYFS